MEESTAAKCLAHPLRRRILDELGKGPRSPNELTTVLDAKLTNLSYHVRMLNELGAIELVDLQPRRGAMEHYYRQKVVIAPVKIKEIPLKERAIREA